MKTDFLVVYDYGTGGVWTIIKARSENEITEKYPMLAVVKERPKWMTDEYYNQVASARTFDVDDPPTGWLLTLTKSFGRADARPLGGPVKPGHDTGG